jgi:hypothetical protein
MGAKPERVAAAGLAVVPEEEEGEVVDEGVGGDEEGEGRPKERTSTEKARRWACFRWVGDWWVPKGPLREEGSGFEGVKEKGWVGVAVDEGGECGERERLARREDWGCRGGDGKAGEREENVEMELDWGVRSGLTSSSSPWWSVVLAKPKDCWWEAGEGAGE